MKTHDDQVSIRVFYEGEPLKASEPEFHLKVKSTAADNDIFKAPWLVLAENVR